MAPVNSRGELTARVALLAGIKGITVQNVGCVVGFLFVPAAVATYGVNPTVTMDPILYRIVEFQAVLLAVNTHLDDTLDAKGVAVTNHLLSEEILITPPVTLGGVGL